jgi:dTDP-4-dehydrorhamnose reductase
MRTLVIGATGQLGQDVVASFGDHEVSTAARRNADHEVDLARPDSLRGCLETVRPEIVVNTAAAHNVPACEADPEEAYSVNATGVAALAEACHEVGAKLIHVSTDYVFGHGAPGATPHPWRESDLPAPLNVYAASKLAGEHLLAAACEDHAIVRSSGLYGLAPCLAKGGKNFVQLMLHLASERDEVKVVTDEVLTPTHTVALANQIRAIALCEARGVFHATCQGQCSWNEFAAAIFEESKTQVRLLPATSEDFPSPVRRPSYSVLENDRLQALDLDVMPHWRDALRRYLEDLDALDR